MINRVVLVGRLTRDPELRRTSTKKAVTSFTLALNRHFGEDNNADYINCIVWNKAAENVDKYCSKGSLVGVEGRLQSRTYENSYGNNVKVVEVVCESVQFLSTKKSNESSVQENSQPKNIQDDDFSSAFDSFNIDDSDIQF